MHPLPDNWRKVRIKGTENILYCNIDDMTYYQYSPIDEEAIAMYKMEIEKRERSTAKNKAGEGGTTAGET
jgi:hypothetical protein